MGGAMALEDMNLDRKADFDFDAFDPFKVGQKQANYNLELSAQEALLAKNTSAGGHIWTPEQLQQQRRAMVDAGLDPETALPNSATQQQLV